MRPLPEQTDRSFFGCIFRFKLAHSRKVCTEKIRLSIEARTVLPVIFDYSAKDFLLRWRA